MPNFYIKTTLTLYKYEIDKIIIKIAIQEL